MIRWWTLLSSPVLNFWQLWSSTQYVSKTPSVILYNVIWLTSHIVYPFNQHFFPRNNLTLTRQMSRFDYTQRYMFETARQCWRLSSSNIREHSSHFFQVFNENSLVITSQITFKGSFCCCCLKSSSLNIKGQHKYRRNWYAFPFGNHKFTF